jgi:hypothetical protein
VLTPTQFQNYSGRKNVHDWKSSIKHHGKTLKALLFKGVVVMSPFLSCSCTVCYSNHESEVLWTSHRNTDVSPNVSQPKQEDYHSLRDYDTLPKHHSNKMLDIAETSINNQTDWSYKPDNRKSEKTQSSVKRMILVDEKVYASLLCSKRSNTMDINELTEEKKQMSKQEFPVIPQNSQTIQRWKTFVENTHK